jgi:hypothetical protein
MRTSSSWSSFSTPQRSGVLALLLPLCLFACEDEEPTGMYPPPVGGGLDSSTSSVGADDAGSVIDAGGGGVFGGASDSAVPPRIDAGGGTIGQPDGGVPPVGTDGAVGSEGGTSDGGGGGAGGACTREGLTAAVNSYYSALSMKNHASLMVAPTVKFTQDGMPMQLGEGLWKTAGEVRFKRSAYDVQQCESVTESVVDNGGDDFIVGLRLKLANGLISEIESILVGPGGFVANAPGVISSASDNWEVVLPEAERSTRDFIQKDIIDAYFIDLFAGDVSPEEYPFASTCRRAENGTSPGACSFGIPALGGMMPLHYVIDVEAGIGVGFVLFGGSTRGLLDFHMFRVKSQQVHGVRAIVGPSVSSRGWP